MVISCIHIGTSCSRFGSRLKLAPEGYLYNKFRAAEEKYNEAKGTSSESAQKSAMETAKSKVNWDMFKKSRQ